MNRETAVGALEAAAVDGAVTAVCDDGVVGAGVVGAEDCAGVAGLGVCPPAEEAEGVMLPLACRVGGARAFIHVFGVPLVPFDHYVVNLYYSHITDQI